MVPREEVESYILGLPNVECTHPFGDEVSVFVIKDGSMFALLPDTPAPLRLSLKCDPLLSKTLREKYETVMPGHNLHPKYWNTVLLTGQLSWTEVQDLIRHAYILADKESDAASR